MRTIVVNAFGGPGSGKTTASWEICSELKKAGILAEYVSEYAKELVYEMNSPAVEEAERAKKLMDGTMESQSILFAEQKHRIDRVMGQVAVVVTDSPILLSAVYCNNKTQEFEDDIIRQFMNYDSFNFLMQRGNEGFEKEGRIHDENESKQKDNEIENILNKYGIPYEEYTHETVSRLVSRIKELSRVFENAYTDKDIVMLKDDYSGVILRKHNASTLVNALDKQKDVIAEEIEEIENEIEYVNE